MDELMVEFWFQNYFTFLVLQPGGYTSVNNTELAVEVIQTTEDDLRYLKVIGFKELMILGDRQEIQSIRFVNQGFSI